MPEKKLERTEHANMCEFIDEAKGHKMLENVKNGDLVIASGYNFIWRGHSIYNNDIYSMNACECEVSDVTKVIRISKVLEFLNQKTDEDFEYAYGVITCDNSRVYDVRYKECCLSNNKIVLHRVYLSQAHTVTMEPSEFIEKIAKGEWL